MNFAGWDGTRAPGMAATGSSLPQTGRSLREQWQTLLVASLVRQALRVLGSFLRNRVPLRAYWVFAAAPCDRALNTCRP